jgi:hypothetical protein
VSLASSATASKSEASASVVRTGPRRSRTPRCAAEPPVRAEHGDGVVQLVQGRGLDLDLGVVAAAQLQFVGDVREQQQDAAQRVGLAHHPQGPAVRQGPAVVRRGLGGAVEVQLPGLPARIVDDLGQLALLAQPVQQFGVGRALVQPGRVDVEQLLEGDVVEGQPLGRAEDGHRVGEVVQGLVMGLDVTAQGVARLLGLGHVDGEGQDRSGQGAGPGQRLGDDPPGAAASAPGRPAEAFLTHADPARLGQQGLGAAVEDQPLVARLLQTRRIDLGQPGAVGPDQFARRVDHPGRGRRGVGQQAQARLDARTGCADRNSLSQATPPDSRPSTPSRRRRVDAHVAGFALFDQGADLARARRRGWRWPEPRRRRRRHPRAQGGAGRDHGLGRTQQTGHAAVGGQADAQVLEGRQGAVALGQGGGPFGLPGLDLGFARGQTTAQPPGPGADRQCQTRRACRRHKGDFGFRHQSSPADSMIHHSLRRRFAWDRLVKSASERGERP